MKRCLKENIKLNPRKLQFKLPEVKFMGNITTKHDMKADPGIITAITTMPTPRNRASVQRFLGMANYILPYCPNLSTTIRPLTALTQKDISPGQRPKLKHSAVQRSYLKLLQPSITMIWGNLWCSKLMLAKKAQVVHSSNQMQRVNSIPLLLLPTASTAQNKATPK